MNRLLWLMVALLPCGCDGCSRSSDGQARSRERTQVMLECESAEDCADEEPCTEHECSGGRCQTLPAAAGTSCEDGDVCNGVARCDGRGRCVAGPAPVIDDGNACTRDSCDPVLGVRHEPVEIDDGDACTVDACDPASGEVTHEPIPIDDGDDCSFDSCDPVRGVQHQVLPPVYTCDASCGAGYHASSRRKAGGACPNESLQTFCMPSCGPSFYTCDADCPSGYRAVTRAPNRQCGADAPPMTFCRKL
jgi:hypothetical protein